MTKTLIELWQTGCEECEAAKPIVAELSKEGFVFERFDIESSEGKKVWDEYFAEIDDFSKKQGQETGYIYTPTFVNPKTRKVLVYFDRPPKKEELIQLVEE